MKTLVLIRHAKSSWDDPGLDDRERPLNKRGKRDAPAMGQLLLEKGMTPDLIVSSPAKRARKTAKILADALDYPRDGIELREALYLQGLETLLAVIASLDDAHACVFLVGHNPELTELANVLTGASIDNIPTAAAVAVDFKAKHWSKAGRGKGACAWFERPVKSRDPE
jgi:phosphohistidine phosphatase